jgi:hypothetical protein
VVTQRIANPSTPVRFRYSHSPQLSLCVGPENIFIFLNPPKNPPKHKRLNLRDADDLYQPLPMDSASRACARERASIFN